MALTEAEYNRIALKVWQFGIQTSGDPIMAIQALADARNNAISAPARVWGTTVNRKDGPVTALQELADAKSEGIRTNLTLNAWQDNGVPVALTPEVIKAIADATAEQIGKPTVSIDYAKIATDVREKFRTEPLSTTTAITLK